MKKGAKKVQKSKKTNSADHVSVMLEDVKDMIMALGEGQGVLSEKVDVLSDKVDIVQGDITRMQDDITDIKHKLSDKVDRTEFDKLEKRVIKVERVILSKHA